MANDNCNYMWPLLSLSHPRESLCLVSGSSLCRSSQFIQMTRKVSVMFSFVKVQASKQPQTPERAKSFTPYPCAWLSGSYFFLGRLTVIFFTPFLDKPAPAHERGFVLWPPRQTLDHSNTASYIYQSVNYSVLYINNSSNIFAQPGQVHFLSEVNLRLCVLPALLAIGYH